MTAAYWWFVTAAGAGLTAIQIAAWWDVRIELKDQPSDWSTRA